MKEKNQAQSLKTLTVTILFIESILLKNTFLYFPHFFPPFCIKFLPFPPFLVFLGGDKKAEILIIILVRKCGKMVKANAKTCPDCDTVLAPDSQYCPNCGKQILRKAVGYQEKSPEGGRSNET